MIRTIDYNFKKTIKYLLILVFCFSCVINSSFLSLKAAQNHYHQTYTGGRVEFEIYTGTTINDVNIDGTTFRAMSYIVADFYLTNTSTGTIKVNFSSSQISTQGLYNAANIYVFGATISGFLQTNSFVTLKINKPTDHIQLVICLTSSDLNNSLEAVNQLIVNTTLTTASSTESSVQDIDVKLSGISSTLQQILSILGSGNTSITDYLDEISAYSEYLEDIQLSLSDIDNQIDTISWINIQSSYGGYTTDFQNYDTTIGEKEPGYFVYNYFYSNPANPGLYRLEIPIGNTMIQFENLKFYTMYNNTIEGHEITFDEYLFFRNRSSIVLYFIVNENYHSWPNGNNPLVVKVNQRVYFYSTTNYKTQYILQDDIEYWTIYQALQNKKMVDALESLVSGASQSDITDQIDDKISELNDVTQQSQTIENQQINNLDSFNNQIDLDDYNFNFNSRNGIEYFKLKLTDIYNIDEFKPFYLIPIVLFVLMALLRG